MPSIAIPDCRHRAEAFYLTEEEKKALVLAIAKGGVGAIEEFVREREAKDPRIRDKIRALKEELLRRAEALKERLMGDFEDRKGSLVKDWQKAIDALEAAERDAESRLVLERATTDRELSDAMRSAPLVHLALKAKRREEQPWWRRLLGALAKAWRFLVSIILYPIRLIARLLTPKAQRKTPRRVGHKIMVPAAGGAAIDIPRDAWDDPELRRAVRGRMKLMSTQERARHLWNYLLGREDYEDLAQRLMEQQVREAAEAKKRDRSTKETQVERELARIREEEEARRRALDEALERLEEERESELARIRAMQENAGVAGMKDEIVSQLEDAGLIERDGGGYRASARLIDRFAEIVFSEEARKVPALHGRAAGTYAEGEGHFTREPMRTIYDISHMDLIGTVLQARSRAHRGSAGGDAGATRTHIFDEDVLVFREEREALHHVVIVMDRSGSMEENDRLLAAKRAVLALHQAVKRENPANPVDLVTMDTGVARADLGGIWASEPQGFTNTAGALRVAGDILLKSRAERGSIYLITDGLPEAYTNAKGVDVASTPEKCLVEAVKEARRLRNRPNLNTVILLLEAEDELFVKAADSIAKEVKGRVVKTDPQMLSREMLVDFSLKQATPVMRVS